MTRQFLDPTRTGDQQESAAAFLKRTRAALPDDTAIAEMEAATEEHRRLHLATRLVIVVVVREAKDRMYELIKRAAGEEVVITRRGREVARLEAIERGATALA